MAKAFGRWIALASFTSLALLLLAVLVTAWADDDLTAIHDIQFTLDPAGDSPYAGQTVQTAGIVTAIYRDGYVIAEPAGGPWSGVYVYDPDHLPATGDYLRITASVSEYYGLTELVDVIRILWSNRTRRCEDVLPGIRRQSPARAGGYLLYRCWQ